MVEARLRANSCGVDEGRRDGGTNLTLAALAKTAASGWRYFWRVASDGDHSQQS
jgi:hypothetical protein